ncbi:MAG: hypothetical protein KBD19_02205 [Candidatus Moranbacteria bacterium]|nr:hypothetical protein [Candidatus Moranbacteria bacterium]
MCRKILITAVPVPSIEPFDALRRLVGVVLTTLRVEGERFIVSATEIASALLDRSDKDIDRIDVEDDWRAARNFAYRYDDEIGIPFAVCKPIVEES